MKTDIKNTIRPYFENKHKFTAYLATADLENNAMPEIRPISLMECDWRFYLASGVSSRKAKELIRHPKAAVLIMLNANGFAGYLRICGSVSLITDENQRRQVSQSSGYPIEKFWNSFSNPALYFAEIIPERIEFMAPGEDIATDVTKEF